MPHAPPCAPVPGAALARLLARMAGRASVPAGMPPAERLGGWLDWPRAVALSRALDGGEDAAANDATGPVPAGADLAEECRRVRASLEAAITGEGGDWTRASGAGGRRGTPTDAVQRHGLRLQREMQAATGRLRGELRERLLGQGGDGARLAAVDAVMEGLLAPREHALLAATVPALVARFEALHAANAAGAAATLPDADADAAAWRVRFRNEAREVLLAELDLRFQPIEALLAALRSERQDA